MKYLISVVLLAFLCVSAMASTTITDKGVYRNLDFQVRSLRTGSFLYVFVESDKTNSRDVLGFFTTTSDNIVHLIFSSEHVQFRANGINLNAGGFARLEDGTYNISMSIKEPSVLGCAFFIFETRDLGVSVTNATKGSCGTSRVDSRICFRYKDYWKNNPLPFGKVFIPSLGVLTEDSALIRDSLLRFGIESEYVTYQLSLLTNRDIFALHSVLFDYNFDSPTTGVLGERLYNYTTVAEFDNMLFRFFTGDQTQSKIISHKLRSLNKPVCGEL